MTKIINFENLDWHKCQSTDTFKELAWVYIITNENTNIIYVWQSWNLKERHSNHHKKNCFIGKWEKYIYVHLANDKNRRLQIENHLINKFNPPCNN